MHKNQSTLTEKWLIWRWLLTVKANMSAFTLADKTLRGSASRPPFSALLHRKKTISVSEEGRVYLWKALTVAGAFIPVDTYLFAVCLIKVLKETFKTGLSALRDFFVLFVWLWDENSSTFHSILTSNPSVFTFLNAVVFSCVLNQILIFWVEISWQTAETKTYIMCYIDLDIRLEPGSWIGTSFSKF